MFKKIVNHEPKEYLQQGLRYCGSYTLKAILSAYNLDDGRSPENYLKPHLRHLWLTTPKLIQESLEKYGFSAPIKRANNLSNKEKIQVIKQELNKNHPIILLIGNGYSPTREYSALRMNCLSHWISVWGYDDQEKVFFIYDSYVDPQNYDKVPIGNVKRTYEQILRDWRGTFYFRFKSFLYLPLIKN